MPVEPDTETAHLFPPLPLPEDLVPLAKERGWPDGLFQRVVDLRPPRWQLEELLSEHSNVAHVERWADSRERLMYGTLQARKADVSDADQFSELWSNSPQQIDDWEVTVERRPNPFAQWRLQDNVVLNVLVDRGLLVACQGNARLDVLVGGQKMTVGFPQAVRVRHGFRRRDYSGLVMGGGGGPHPNSPVENALCWYVRAKNFVAYEWMKARGSTVFDHAPERDDDVPGIDVRILLYPGRRFEGDRAGIRPAAPADLRRCAGLVNRTHRRTDLFRPYTAEFMERRLDEGFWGPKPDWFQPVYAWPDFFVLEEHGQVVACAGLWDRGRDIREVWRRADGSQERVIAATALMDFGFAARRDDAMARLISFLVGKTHELDRTYLMAPLQFLPRVAALLESHDPVVESRAMQWVTPSSGSPEPDPPLRRPYTDLAYW